jgi:hypothetical protein
MFTDSNVINAVVMETDESRLEKTLTAYSFSKELQLEVKREAEASWTADGYIILSNKKILASAFHGKEPECKDVRQ